MWRHLVRVLECHLALIRYAHDPWGLCLGLCGVAGSLESLVFSGYDGYQLKVLPTPAARFHELPALVQSTVRETRDTLGRALNGLVRRFDDRNDTVGVPVSSGLLGYTLLSDRLVLAGNEGNARFTTHLLRAWALLEYGQGFDALLLLDGLEQTNSPSVVCLAPEVRVSASLVRIQVSHDAANRPENQPAPHESRTGNQQHTGNDQTRKTTSSIYNLLGRLTHLEHIWPEYNHPGGVENSEVDTGVLE